MERFLDSVTTESQSLAYKGKVTPAEADAEALRLLSRRWGRWRNYARDPDGLLSRRASTRTIASDPSISNSLRIVQTFFSSSSV